MIAPNTIVGGRYRVTRPLGGGGMKLVYLAEDLRLAARPCARNAAAGGRRVSARS
jgi:serine/threonine protein kinase